MKFSILLFLFPLYAFSMTAKEFEAEYRKIEAKDVEQVKACINQNKLQINSILEVDNSKPGQVAKLVKSEDEMNIIFDQYSAEVNFPESNFLYSYLILNNCSEENLKLFSELEKNRPGCHGLMVPFNFMKAIVYSTKNDKWKTETINKGKTLILKNIQVTVNNAKTPLIFQAFNAAILKDMVDNNLIDKKFKKDIDSIVKGSDKEAHLLQAKMKKNTKSSFNCPMVTQMLKGEYAASAVIRKRLSKLLTQIK